MHNDTPRPVQTLLIANRGEIAVRIARTARRMGIATVAVHSSVDRDAPHVLACDLAVDLGGDSPATSYLRQDAILGAAARTGADAVHPGFGFLAENASFAQAVLDAGLTWVGPSPDAIATMGDKLAAKRAVEAAGVPLLPSIELTDDTDLLAVAREIGLPVMVKAAAGGGGTGMRVVRDAASVVDAVGAARREAVNAFGDDRLFMERLVENPRHLEVQILGDLHGNLVHLFERDCSIQRRHQKVVEEAPSPFVDPDLRARLTEAALAAGRAVDYVNAGTVEFVADADGGFAFLEVNTRLQVEHPVTEAITGVDLVEQQLLIAGGAPIGFTQDQLTMTGHAIEVRLYAEDPTRNDLPSTGRVATFDVPDDPGIRVDSGVVSGSTVTVHYDPMIAKVIAHGSDRGDAARRLARVLDRTVVLGPVTNRDLLRHVLRHPAFLGGDVTTGFLGTHVPVAERGGARPTPHQQQRAAIAAVLVPLVTAMPAAGVGSMLAFSNTSLPPDTVAVTIAGDVLAVRWRRLRDGTFDVVVGSPVDDSTGLGVDDAPIAWVLDEQVRHVVSVDAALGRLSCSGRSEQVMVHAGDAADGHPQPVAVVLADIALTVRLRARHPAVEPEEIAGATLAPMPGAVLEVAVDAGQEVAKGALLVVLEAMKMEHRIVAPADGVVSEVRVQPGSQVEADDVLVVLDAG